MKFVVLIPARYESSRFPGKPLAKIGGEELIIRVCRQVDKTGLPLAVATDNDLIAQTVRNAGFDAVMTASSHRSGTERVEEAYRNLRSDADGIINVQGDEPFIDTRQILSLSDIFKNNPDTEIATLARPFDPALGFDALPDPNLVKVVMSEQGRALYFSRSVIPFVRNTPTQIWLEKVQYYSHIGLYAYRASALSTIVSLPPAPLETVESLEQLRWLQNGLVINVGISSFPTIGIDTPQDLENAEKFLKNFSN